MNRVPAKIAEEVRVLFENPDADARPGEEIAEHHPGGSAASARAKTAAKPAVKKAPVVALRRPAPLALVPPARGTKAVAVDANRTPAQPVAVTSPVQFTDVTAEAGLAQVAWFCTLLH